MDLQDGFYWHHTEVIFSALELKSISPFRKNKGHMISFTWNKTKEWKVSTDGKPLALDYRNENAEGRGGG